MLLRNCFVAVCMLFFAKLYAQVKITGRVADEQNRPLVLASVVIIAKDSSTNGTTTNEQGNFVLALPGISSSQIRIRISLLGYKTITQLFNYPDTAFLQQITLTEENQLLRDVTVTAKKPLITRKADRYIVNVENSFLADGNSGMELLQKVPGLWIDNNDNIRIKGNQSVTVMINDVVQRMSGEDLASYLRSLRSEDVSRIEIIPNPPSEYEAAGSGGMVHIILKKTRRNGLNGTVNAQYKQQGTKPYASSGFSANWKLNNLYLNGGYTFNKDIKSFYEKSVIRYPAAAFYDSYTTRDEDNSRPQYRLGVTYDINKDHSLGVLWTATRNRFTQTFGTDILYGTGNQKITGVGNVDRLRENGFSETTINYSWAMDSMGSRLKIIGGYSGGFRKENNHFSTLFSDPTRNNIYRSSLPNNTAIYNIQADYTKVIDKQTNIKAGAKYASIERDNATERDDLINNNWIPNTANTDHFIYSESLLMLYTSAEKNIRQTTIKIGLRAEETFSNGNSITTNTIFKRNYWGLFPSIFLSRVLNKEKVNTFSFSYARRLQRPTLFQLNPFRYEYTNNTSGSGNPELQPEFSHNFELNYQFLRDFFTGIYLTGTENVIGLLATAGSNNFIDYRSENINSSLEYGINGSANVNVSKQWKVTNNLSLTHLAYRITGQKIRQNSLAFRMLHNIELSKTIALDATADYRSPYTSSNYRTSGNFYLDAGITKKLWSGKGRLRLYGTDLFNGLREKEVTDFADTYILFLRKRPTRTVSLSLSYNFSSGKKFSGKKIDSGDGEERGRSN